MQNITLNPKHFSWNRPLMYMYYMYCTTFYQPTGGLAVIQHLRRKELPTNTGVDCIESVL